MVEVKNLSKSYGKNEVLRGINFNINDGEIFALVGHSGAGKSTLLRCLNGLENYQKGSVKINDIEISSIKKDEIREFRKNIGMIFQNFALMSRKTVFENVALPLKVWKFDSSEINKRVKELLKLVGLENRQNFYPRELSGGQKQRVAIARALALNPKILLSDEATSALDPNTTKSILALLKKINEELKITIVLVTHEMDVVKSIANRAVLLDNGKIVNAGNIQELFLKPNENMKKFLGYDEILPSFGTNIRLYFPKQHSMECTITNMARKLDINFNFVWGKLEKLNEDVLGNLVINIKNEDTKNVTEYLAKTGVLWEVVKDENGGDFNENSTDDKNLQTKE